MSTAPDVSIIIVNWNVRELLAACLESLERCASPGVRAEVCVVDNHSNDGSVEMIRARFPGVHLIINDENVGFARANNMALPWCRARLVMLLNPDTEVREGALSRLVEFMDANPGVGVAGAGLLNTDGTFQAAGGGAFPSLANVAWHGLFLGRILPSGLAPKPLFFDRAPTGVLESDWISGAAMMIRRELLQGRIFDDSFFMFGEDMELCHRVRSAGRRVVVVASAAIVHHHGASMGKQTSGDVLTAVVKGPRAYFAMHHSRAALALYDLIIFVSWAIRSCGYAGLAVLRRDRAHATRAGECARCARAAALALVGVVR